MTGKELAQKALAIATQYKTLYVSGGWGQPATPSNKTRAINQYQYNRNIANKIRAVSSDTFFFDCVCLIKGILWGWQGLTAHGNGGAAYASNGVPDVGEGTMINLCRNVTTDFKNTPPEIGEAVWMAGHIGIYVGDGLAVECTPAWNDCVQITAVGNIGKKAGYNTRTWTKHGKLPWVIYTGVADDTPVTNTVQDVTNTVNDYTVDELAQMVISGHFGNGATRKNALGARYEEVQRRVDEMLRQPKTDTTGAVIYTVKKGDYLGAIAQKYNTSVEQIVKDNNIANKNLIHIGQRLIING